MVFPTTRWSLIRAVGEPEQARAAWSELATLYRPAIVSFCAARFGHQQAEDLTQQFFAESMASSWWSRADADLGSFRTYLRVLLIRFGARHGTERLTNTAGVESIEPDVPVNEFDARNGPERAYESAFAQVLIQAAREALFSEYADQPEQLALIPILLEGSDHGDLKDMAEHMGVPQNTLTQRLRRLRLRFRDFLRAQIADLVSDPANTEAELTDFLATLRR